MTQYEILQSFIQNLRAVATLRPGSPTYFARAQHLNELLFKSEINGFITYAEYRELRNEYNEICDAVSDELFNTEGENVDSSPVTASVSAEAARTSPSATCRQVRLRYVLTKAKCSQPQTVARNLIIAALPVKSFGTTVPVLNL